MNGLAKMQYFSLSKYKKLRYAYLLMLVGVAEKPKLAAEFLMRKVVVCETLKAEIEALEAEMNSSKVGPQ